MKILVLFLDKAYNENKKEWLKMQYAITFLEGIIAFVSPCLLPMLPIYISYFAGEKHDAKQKTVKNALGFVLGFTLVFIALGAFAGFFGGFLTRYKTVVNVVTGGIVILFGLNFMGIINVGFINNACSIKNNESKISGFFSAVLFGIIFSISWTPCVGASLGAALMKAAGKGSVLQGILLLLCYSFGLGIPFLLSAALIEHMKNAFTFIKKHYRIINTVSGVFLVIIGILMVFGQMDRFLSLLTI